jgi:competence protein ComEC
MALEIFVPNTGQGDCTFITFPNGKNMLVDINRTDVDVDIIEFLRKKIPKKKHEDIDKTCRRLNYFVNTHPHEDHLKGVGDLDTDEFYIDQIWESGHRLYVPADQKDKYKHYYDFLALVSKLSKRNAVTKLRAGRAPKTYIGSTAVYVFAPSSYIVDSKSREEIHNQCAVLRIEYTGNSILLTGDSYRDSWENRIVPQYSDDKVESGKRLENLLKSTVLHAAHHVSKYFFVKSNDDDDKYKRAMDKIKPSFTVISVGVGNKHGHPHQIAMNIYREKTKYGRVWTTKDEKSMYFALKNDGKVEYKKGLDYDDLTSIKHEAESFDSAIRKTAATLSFGIREDIEMELPNRPPKVKREGYR